MFLGKHAYVSMRLDAMDAMVAQIFRYFWSSEVIRKNRFFRKNAHLTSLPLDPDSPK